MPAMTPSGMAAAMRNIRIRQAKERSPMGFDALVADGMDEWEAACLIMTGEPLAFDIESYDPVGLFLHGKDWG